MKLTHFAWDIRFCVCEKNDLFNFSKHKVVKEIESDKKIFKIRPVFINADPFLFVRENCMCLFYEEQIMNGRGVIKMTKTKDLREWSTPVTVLKEDFHLSFPFVFEDHDQVYMIPETGRDNSIRLYVPNENLTRWYLSRKLLEGKKYVDSSIFVENGVYYLFTTTTVNQIFNLELYTSNSLNEEFVKHPCSPVCVGNIAGRNAGVVFRYKNEIYRPAQKCDKYYGESIILFKIKKMTRMNYEEERIVDSILPKDVYYKTGGHHFNIAFFDGKYCVATDRTLLSEFSIWALINKIRIFIGKIWSLLFCLF